MSTCARRFFFVALLILLHCRAIPFAFGAVSETEPNNQLSQPNLIQCGDTVLCANLPIGDFDHYRFLAPGGDTLYCRTFACGDDNTNTYIALFTDDCQCVAYDFSNSGPMYYSTVGYWVQESAYFRLRVMRGDQVYDADSTYSLCVSSRTPVAEDFDYCETARVVPSFPYWDEGDTYYKADNIGTPAPDVFYFFHQPVQSDVLLEVCSAFNARVQIIQYCMGGYLDDADEGCENGATLVSYDLPAGDYYVIVEGMTDMDFGEYTIEIAPYFPDCPAPRYLILFPVGGQPALDWLDAPFADYYVILQSPQADGPFEYLDISPISYYVDPTGFAADRRFYQVITVCAWSR
ncbi:hypothetical protein KKG66_07740 [bacterium]|nr:hypothetical protein [bacterium]